MDCFAKLLRIIMYTYLFLITQLQEMNYIKINYNNDYCQLFNTIDLNVNFN